MTTWEEYQADTDPAVFNSVLKLEGKSADLTEFSFPASSNRYYQLIYATDLAGPFLTNDLGWGVPGMVITNDATGGWFGRIRVWTAPPP